MKRNEVDRSKLSPGMRQYMEIKDNYEEELLFFRLGDFYELFFEDGLICSRELELTLTSKNAGLDERVPMCGVPFHSVTPYIEKLIEKGYKVAICEQLEDPKKCKGVVKRGVVQVYSKGSIVDAEMLKAYDNNYIGSILDFNYEYIITYADISTGHLYSLTLDHDLNKVVNQVLKLGLKEVILADDTNQELINLLKNNYNIDISISRDYLASGYEYLFSNLKDVAVITGVKHLLYYLVVRELKDLSHINNVEIVSPEDYLEMDIHTIRNLELIETLRLKERNNSLIWLLDKCKTAMGSRLLKDWLLKPLKDINKLNERYDKIAKLNEEFMSLDELRNALYEIYDIERLCGKVSCGNLNGRDVLQLKNSLVVLPYIRQIITNLGFDYTLVDVNDLYELLDKAIYENPPVGIKEGYLIKDGYNQELDELKAIRSGGKDFIAELENTEREKTGIKNLKVGYNKVFGYYIEISKGQTHLVDPSYGYERRQTLANCERYISPLLKEKEALVLNAEERIIEIEYNLFNEIRDILKKRLFDLQSIAKVISELDVICALAVDASELRLVRPTLTSGKDLTIIDGRHPVVERVSKIDYVANDCRMSNGVNTLLITGPNMSGKSTYMRQLGIIVIMAQIGSYVPAKAVEMPIFDKIFTRIGASDDLVSGESTFMIEMKEAKNAICNATAQSLILFDELGRGTATYDGMSLAQAILEYVSENIGCKVLFSTHYHELTALEEKINSIKNVHVSASEKDGNVTFLHKVVDGAVDKSYGIHVAKLAGMPDGLLKRAKEILDFYESNDKKADEQGMQCSFDFSEPEVKNPILDKLREADVLRMTPIEAINFLYELKDMDK